MHNSQPLYLIAFFVAESNNDLKELSKLYNYLIDNDIETTSTKAVLESIEKIQGKHAQTEID